MYFKILFLGIVVYTLSVFLMLLATVSVIDDQQAFMKNLFSGLLIFGWLPAFLTVYETTLEEGFLSGFISLASLSIPILGSYFLFSFLIKEIRKENEVANKNI